MQPHTRAHRTNTLLAHAPGRSDASIPSPRHTAIKVEQWSRHINPFAQSCSLGTHPRRPLRRLRHPLSTCCLASRWKEDMAFLRSFYVADDIWRYA